MAVRSARCLAGLGRRGFHSTATLLGRKTEFMSRLKLANDGLQKGITDRTYWEKVYEPNCKFVTSGVTVEGLDYMLDTIPGLTTAFKIEPNVVEVIGKEDDSKFTVWYRHTATFVGPFGTLQPNNRTGIFEGVNIYEVTDDGRTKLLVQSLDLLSYFMQVGAVQALFEAPVAGETEEPPQQQQQQEDQETDKPRAPADSGSSGTTAGMGEIKMKSPGVKDI
eukprot:Sspe_Gene.15097::Locus_5239_Transcript_1_1_Confidence_1.000_Length_1078::g.15097::m.15097